MRREFGLLLLLTSAACSSSPEQPIVSQFFAASRLYDKTALGNFSLVSFDPGTDGIVIDFDITSVSAERSAPMNVNEPAQASVAYLSLSNLDTAPDIQKQAGELVTKDVTVSAPVKQSDGQTVPKTLIITLQRAVLKGHPGLTGRWVVTANKNH